MGDFDGDGFVDVVVAESGNRQSLFWVGNGAGAFTTSRQISGGAGAADVATADVDQDGDLDLFFCVPGAGRLNVSYNQGNGLFNSVRGQRLTPTGLTSLAVGDIDNDGALEVVVGGEGGVDVFRNNGRGNLAYWQWIERPSVSSVALGDLDGDGDLDLIAGRGASNENQSALVWLFDAARFALFDNGQSLGGAYTASIALADFDGDDDLDAAFGNRANGNGDATSIWLNAGVAGDTAPFDGRIDLIDLNNVRNWFGATGQAATSGDTDGDSDVDLVDLNAVRNNFGASADSVPISPRALTRSAGDSIVDDLARDRTAQLHSANPTLDALVWQSALEQLDAALGQRIRRSTNPWQRNAPSRQP